MAGQTLVGGGQEFWMKARFTRFLYMIFLIRATTYKDISNNLWTIHHAVRGSVLGGEGGQI